MTSGALLIRLSHGAHGNVYMDTSNMLFYLLSPNLGIILSSHSTFNPLSITLIVLPSKCIQKKGKKCIQRKGKQSFIQREKSEKVPNLCMYEKYKNIHKNDLQ